MSTTICGHKRERLIFVLQRADVCPGECDWKMIKVVHDPAKLAAIIAELMTQSGFPMGTGNSKNWDMIARARGWIDGMLLTWCYDDEHDRPDEQHDGILYHTDIDSGRDHRLTMPQARAFVLRLLETPTATAQDIERMIGELYALG